MGMLFCLQSKSSGGIRPSRMEEVSVQNEQRAGYSSTSKTKNSVAHMKAVLDRDRHLSVRLMTEEVDYRKRTFTESLRKNCT